MRKSPMSFFTELREGMVNSYPSSREEDIAWMEEMADDLRDMELPADMTIGDAFLHIRKEINRADSIHQKLLEAEKQERNNEHL